MAGSYKQARPKEQRIICQNPKCTYKGRYQSISNFYKSHNELVPTHPFCKNCVNSMVDITNIDTIYDVLKQLDIPFIMDIWNKACLDTDNSQLGTYLQMIGRNKSYDNLYWEDSIFELTEIDKISPEVIQSLDKEVIWSDNWQGEYTRKELEYMDSYYEKYITDFKVVTENHKDYVKEITKNAIERSRAYNEMLKGVAGADKRYKTAISIFDTLSKSAQFAESQRSANDVSLGCFGVVFDKVEKHNWIPEYVPEKEDVYDTLIKQFSNIDRSL